MTEVVTHLSGAPDSKGSAIAALAQFGVSLTTIHEVPAGETHEIWLHFSSMHGSNSIEILGDMGEETTNFDLRMAVEDNQSRGPFVLLGGSGGTSIALAAVADWTSIRISGTVRKHS